MTTEHQGLGLVAGNSGRDKGNHVPRRTIAEASGRYLLASGLVIFVALNVYILSAPFVIPMVNDTRAGRGFYKPVLCALEKEWFGRGIVSWYCYDVCEMNLLVPRETSGPKD
jgi:hypothetical protein